MNFLVNTVGYVAGLSFLMNGFSNVNGQIFCDDEYNTSSCADTTLTASQQYRCRGFMSCKDSEIDNNKNLYCLGDRACKNVGFTNDDGDYLMAYGYQSADSMTIYDEVYYIQCYGYQSCLDMVFDLDDDVSDAYAYGYQSMMNAYIDYSDEVYSLGYESLYYATINTTAINNDAINIEIYGYYGSYETDVLCQDGITCNFYAYGYYATEETYLYCKPGAECNVYCGDTNGCVGMNLLCYSTATCYFNCDDATECPTESDAYSVLALQSLTKEEKSDGKKRYTDDEFDRILDRRLRQKEQKKHEYKEQRMQEESQYFQSKKQQKNGELAAAPVVSSNYNDALQSTLIESGLLLVVGMFIGILGNCGYNKCMAKKDYQYRSIV